MKLFFDDIPDRWRTKIFGEHRSTEFNWIRAQPMPKAELAVYDQYSVDFYYRGWKASALGVGDAVGILATADD